MKTLSTLLLAVAALAAAAPNAAGPEVLDPRQTCVYSCGCQTDDGSGIDPDTATCCANVGGSLGNDGTVRVFSCFFSLSSFLPLPRALSLQFMPPS
jgi:hypothetical protein